MTKAQVQAKLDCQLAKCRDLRRCKIHWGRRCNRQDGKKVPRFRRYQMYSYDDVSTAREW